MKHTFFTLLLLLITTLSFGQAASRLAPNTVLRLSDQDTCTWETVIDTNNILGFTYNFIPIRKKDRRWEQSNIRGLSDTLGNFVRKQDTIPNGNIMTVSAATTVIDTLDTKINGKVPNNRTLGINFNGSLTTQDLSANRVYTITEVDGSVTNELELPSQSGQSGKVLSTNGTSTSWITLPSNPTATVFTTKATGTTYNLTTTSSKVDFGTTDPAITITTPGTYEIKVNLKLAYSGLTSLGVSTATLKVRRTNNTATDLESTTFDVPVVTLLTGTAGDCDIAVFYYTTSNSNDVLEIWGNRGANITVGNLVVAEASISALRIN